MHIQRVRIQGIRCFRTGEFGVDLDLRRPDGTLAGWTVIAGRNGTGKSTFLQAMALAIAGKRDADQLRGSFGDWIREGEEYAEVTVTIVPDARDGDAGTSPQDLTLRWHSPAEPPGNGASTRRRRREPRLTDAISGTRFDSIFTLDHSRLDSEAVLGGRDDTPWTATSGWFIAGYGPFRRLSGETDEGKRLRESRPQLARLASLFRESVSLGDCVEWLVKVNHRKLKKDLEAERLEKSILDLLDDGLLPEPARILRVDEDGLWIERHGIELSLHELSDGYRTAVGLILDIARQMHECFGELPLIDRNGKLAIDLPGLVLIDEIDAHLHVSWQQQIGFWLKERFPKVQFLVTTHSPFICQAADGNGLIRLPAPHEERIAELLPADAYRQIVNGSSDDAVLSILFGLEYSRSRQAESKFDELAQLEAKVLYGQPSPDERARYEAIENELPTGPSADMERTLRRLGHVLDKSAD